MRHGIACQRETSQDVFPIVTRVDAEIFWHEQTTAGNRRDPGERRFPRDGLVHVVLVHRLPAPGGPQ